ncbi:MAG: acetolactate synthase [Massilibacteroides sp.]|nr:acetolactate synthase [Massilibacteroides sp.]
MTVDQISIFLENKYGKLHEILGLFAEANIRILAATVSDTSEYGILRIIADHPKQAYTLLKEKNVSANLSEVIALIGSNETGSIANAFRYFKEAGITIEYMYCYSTTKKSVVFLRTNNRDAARDVIIRKNLGYITEDELVNL